MTLHLRTTYPVVIALAGLCGCAPAPAVRDAAAQRNLLALVMPSRIEIVEPFTQVKSFDDNRTPDGIELLLQAVNSLGNAGLMVAGDIRVELFEHVRASGDRKGQRLERWDVELSTEEHQRTHWNQVTQMYEFRLRVDPTVIPLADQYVLVVTYNSPLGEHLTAECVIGHQPSAGPLGGGWRNPPVSPT